MEPEKAADEPALEDAPTRGKPSTDVLPSGPNGPLSLPSRLVLAVVVVVVTMTVAVHLLLVFLYLAPSNTISNRHRELVNGYIYPEFDQNWKLFAPNPLQGNITVHARADVLLANGSQHITNWVSLTAQDIARIQDNPAPSHAYQNLLRQAWDFYTRTHDDKGMAIGLQGQLSEIYVRRIAASRLGSGRFGQFGGQVVRVQISAKYTPITPPRWSDEIADTKTTDQTLPWWPVSKEDFR
ncbi:DUF5819 family protein [Streptomyces sp. NPDC047061]|uniref:DUF5819 family protein n=1 Tax=Streptomyces sp. NPDC047061 TaxID=3154605 RepID=UPI0033CA7F48